MMRLVRVPAASPEFWEMRTAMRSRGIPDSRMPEARMALCASHMVILVADGHGPEILGGNPEFIAGDMKVHEGAHLAVGLVRDARPRIIKAVVIPPGRRHQGNAALHGQACRPDLFRTLAKGIEDAHPGDGHPVAIVSQAGGALRSRPTPGVGVSAAAARRVKVPRFLRSTSQRADGARAGLRPTRGERPPASGLY